MTSRYDLPHLDLSRRVQAVPFTSTASNPVGAGTPRSRVEHGAKLRGELAATYRAFDAARREDERIESPEGAFLEVELKRSTRIETIERKRDGITPGAARREETDIRIVGLYVPDEAREVFLDILREYQEGELTPKGKPRRKGFVEAIESIRQARLETFWTDDVSRLPPPGREMWWEIWCMRGFEDDLEDLIERLGARAAERERRLYFPEHVVLPVLPVLAAKAAIELMLFARRVAPYVGLAEGVSRHHGSSRAMRLPILPVDQEIRHALKIADYVYLLELGRRKFEGPAGQVSRSGEGVLGGVGGKQHGVSRWGPDAVHDFAVPNGVPGPIRDLPRWLRTSPLGGSDGSNRTCSRTASAIPA